MFFPEEWIALYLTPSAQAVEAEEDSQDDAAIAFIPFCAMLSGKIGPVLKKHRGKIVSHPTAKTLALLGSVKDELTLQKSGSLKFPANVM